MRALTVGEEEAGGGGGLAGKAHFNACVTDVLQVCFRCPTVGEEEAGSSGGLAGQAYSNAPTRVLQMCYRCVLDVLPSVRRRRAVAAGWR
eukprot:840911-Prorocentrum_minimum.AAC.1